MRVRTAFVVVLVMGAMGVAGPAMGQISGPVGPALTAEQIAQSKAMAAKLDQAAVLEKRRLETYKERPLAAVIQRTLDIYTNYLALAAEMMPESSYGFRPTPDVRTFGEQINHASSTQYSFCNQVGLPPGVERQTMVRPVPTTKAGIVAAFKASTEYCSRVLAAAPESWLMETVPSVGGPSSGKIRGVRAHIFIYNLVHNSDDYGTITTYLRLQGIVPPSSALDVPEDASAGAAPR